MRFAIVIALLGSALFGIWWLAREPEPERQPELVSVPEPRPAPRYPLPEPEPEEETLILLPVETIDAADSDEPPELEVAAELPEPLPTLIDSDAPALSALGALIGSDAVGRWLRPEWIISRLVATVHSLDGPAPAVESRPLALLRGSPQTQAGDEDALLWTSATAQRYAELTGLLLTATPGEVATPYRRYYPLFQQAWEELGDPEPWFNDRLIDIIDHLLTAPEVDLPIEVVPFEGRLQFADEALEDQSWGRKLLIRLGPEQARQVQDWLRAFRHSITGEA